MRTLSLLSRLSARRKGLTLIEILVVSAIFAIIALSLFVVFRAGLESWSRTQAHLEVYQTARTAIDWLTRDLSAAYLNSNNANIEFRAWTAGGSTWVLPSGGSEAFFIAALNPTQNDPNAKFELCHVGYWLNSTTHELMRYYYTQVGAAPDYSFPAHVGTAALHSKVAKNVIATAPAVPFSLLFFDSAGTSFNWWDSRNSSTEPTMRGRKPSKVQITLTIQEPNSTRQQTFTTGVYIPQ
ncbi:MAG: prepilin-type N-terminal cleavage/methylation domain-containing protein [Candidatus Omnitrophota bacterium]